jgi:hypothetical protein
VPQYEQDVPEGRGWDTTGGGSLTGRLSAVNEGSATREAGEAGAEGSSCLEWSEGGGV